MNAIYAGSIGTTSKTVFQSLDCSPAGFDIEGCLRYILYNHDTTNYLLVQEPGMHPEVASTPGGVAGGADAWGALGAAVQWLPVAPGGFLILEARPVPGGGVESIKKVNIKSSSGTISFSAGVLSRR